MPVGLDSKARVRLIRAMVARHQRNARRLHSRLGSVLAAHQGHRLGRRPDEYESDIPNRLGEGWALGQEAVAGMNRLDACSTRRVEHALDAR